MQWFSDHYLRTNADRQNPYAAPLRAADLRGLPPALVITAEYDPLRDEGEAYAARLRAAGVPVSCVCYAGMVHGFMSLAPAVDRALAAAADVGAALRAAFHQGLAEESGTWSTKHR